MSVPSPCIGVCQLNEAKVCQGCHRTIDEIALWSSMTSVQRQRTLDRINDSQRSHSSPTAVGPAKVQSFALGSHQSPTDDGPAD